MNEAAIEKKVCAHAKKLGWLAYKFASPSNRGVPDRIFMRHGAVFFIEFKGTGKRASDLQNEMMRKIHTTGGIDCYTVDNAEIGRKIIDARS